MTVSDADIGANSGTADCRQVKQHPQIGRHLAFGFHPNFGFYLSLSHLNANIEYRRWISNIQYRIEDISSDIRRPSSNIGSDIPHPLSDNGSNMRRYPLQLAPISADIYRRIAVIHRHLHVSRTHLICHSVRYPSFKSIIRIPDIGHWDGYRKAITTGKGWPLGTPASLRQASKTLEHQ